MIQIKKYGSTIFICLVMIGILLLPGQCSKPAEDSFSGISVIVSIPPQKYFVEKIGGEYCRVQTLIPAGASPHTFEPKPKQMALLARARLYFSVGVEMERAWLPKLKGVAPDVIIVPTDSGIPGIGDNNADDHSHHQKAEHEGHHHDGADPHIWLSPRLVRLQAAIILKALAAVDTLHAEEYKKRYDLFMTEIDTLQRQIAARLEQCGAPEQFLVMHPSWGYFADEFGLRQIAVEVDGREPGGRALANIVSVAKREGIRTVMVQPQNSAKTARLIAGRIGGAVVTADPLAEDWAGNLEHIAEVLCGQ